MQMCHFHQLEILRRYLTQNPRLEAHIELKQLSSTLTSIDKESWLFALDYWHQKWQEYLKEKPLIQLRVNGIIHTKNYVVLIEV